MFGHIYVKYFDLKQKWFLKLFFFKNHIYNITSNSVLEKRKHRERVAFDLRPHREFQTKTKGRLTKVESLQKCHFMLFTKVLKQMDHNTTQSPLIFGIKSLQKFNITLKCSESNRAGWVKVAGSTLLCPVSSGNGVGGNIILPKILDYS